jgi:hypothetical protein
VINLEDKGLTVMKVNSKPRRVLRSTKRQLLAVVADEYRLVFLSRIKKRGRDKYQLMESEN